MDGTPPSRRRADADKTEDVLNKYITKPEPVKYSSVMKSNKKDTAALVKHMAFLDEMVDACYGGAAIAQKPLEIVLKKIGMGFCKAEHLQQWSDVQSRRIRLMLRHLANARSLPSQIQKQKYSKAFGAASKVKFILTQHQQF